MATAIQQFDAFTLQMTALIAKQRSYIIEYQRGGVTHKIPSADGESNIIDKSLNLTQAEKSSIKVAFQAQIKTEIINLATEMAQIDIVGD